MKFRSWVPILAGCRLLTLLELRLSEENGGFFVFVTLVLCGCAAGKECTNIPTRSHMLRFAAEEDFSKKCLFKDVRLHKDSILGGAQQTNLEYMLIWSFRKTVGLSTPGTPYGGWEGVGVQV
ncbi:hypothetical protein glysoja_010175 [Glycine soja]|nr:hypothetical protein glysoja_010175 [Glycine soja]